MARMWASRAGYLLVVAAVVVMPAPVSSQENFSLRKTIVNPDFPCGEPYGENGEPPTSSRLKRRQIIFPDEPIYNQYWAQLTHKGDNIDIREGQTPEEETQRTICGAVVISDRFIVTAAHCVYSPDNPIGSVRLGDIDLSSETDTTSKPVDHEIKAIFAHPNYNPESRVRHNDVALLVTKERIQFNDVVFPYCISDEVPPPGTEITLAGYGLYNATYYSDHLLVANFTVIDTKECEDIYIKNFQEAQLRLRYPNLLQDTDIICALDDVSDACQGDSGGPVFLNRNGKRYLEGIVSGGANCRANFKSELPGLYLTLAKHVNFIDNFMFSPPPGVL